MKFSFYFLLIYLIMQIRKLIPDIETFEEFETLILKAYKEISPVAIKDLHSLMKEYADVLIAVRDDKSDYEELGNAFFQRWESFTEIESWSSVKDDLGGFVKAYHDEKYVPWVIFRLGMQREAEKPTINYSGRYIQCELFKWFKTPPEFKDLADLCLVNQIIDEEKEFRYLTYRLDFNRGSPFHANEGIEFASPNYNIFKVKRGYKVTQEIIEFPDSTLIKHAHIMERPIPGWSRPPTLFSIDINLSYESVR